MSSNDDITYLDGPDRSGNRRVIGRVLPEEPIIFSSLHQPPIHGPGERQDRELCLGAICVALLSSTQNMKRLHIRGVLAQFPEHDAAKMKMPDIFHFLVERLRAVIAPKS